ncbi:MAG: DUF4185 domain-containing protein [Fimbriimonas sp.]
MMLPASLLVLVASPSIDVVPGSVAKVSQVTGEMDRERNKPTDNQTETKFGLRGTDLGASFEHEGKLVILFGDTHPNGPNTPDRPFDGDAIAFSDDRNPDDGFTMDFVKAADGKYLAVAAPGVSLKGFEVPNGGFSHGGYIYGYFTTDAIHGLPRGMGMGRCVLLRSRDGRKWESLYTVSTGKFINVSPWVVDAAKTPGLPTDKGKGVLLWAGSREYRRSDPYLAFLPLDKVNDPSAMRYWAGDGSWSRLETEAAPLFAHKEIGEISVVWCAPMECWLMLYNSGSPRGIVMRTADRPWGPWSDAKVLYNPQDGYGKYMHVSWRSEKKDSVHDPGRENEYGGEYAPYMIPRFFKGNRDEATIYFLMSIWNPYQVVLMKGTLRRN